MLFKYILHFFMDDSRYTRLSSFCFAMARPMMLHFVANIRGIIISSNLFIQLHNIIKVEFCEE